MKVWGLFVYARLFAETKRTFEQIVHATSRRCKLQRSEKSLLPLSCATNTAAYTAELCSLSKGP